MALAGSGRHGGGVRRAALPVALLLAGCPQDINTLDDAGVRLDAAVRADGGADDAGVDPGADAGFDDAGPLDEDAGPADGGASEGPFAWTRFALPANTRAVNAIWGRSRQEVYFGTANGILLMFDGARVNQIWRTPTNHDIVAIWGTATQLFVADRANLYVSNDGFASVGAQLAVGQGVGAMHGLSEQLVFLVSERTSSRGLFRYDGAAVTEVAPNLVTASINAVLVEPGPQVRIAGNGRIILYDGVGTRDEPAVWPAGWSTSDIANFFIYDLVQTPGGRIAVGTGGGVMSDAEGEWRFTRMPAGSEDLRAVAIGGPDALVAVGEPIDGHPVWWRRPGGWEPDPYQGNEVFHDVWFADPAQVFVGGFPRSGLDGVVLRGDRAP